MRVVDVFGHVENECEKKVLYCPNPGNAGDSIINYKIINELEKRKVNYEKIDINYDQRVKNKIVIYGGGGNLVEGYSYARKFIEKFHRKADKLIVMPHTIYGNEKMIKSLKNNVKIFCREEKSFRYVSKINSKVELYLTHDVVFDVSTEKILKQKKNVLRGLKRNALDSIKSKLTEAEQNIRIKHACIEGIKAYFNIILRNRKISCMRTDGEATEETRPLHNVDVSKLFDRECNGFSDYKKTTEEVFSFLSLFDTVATNRLHVCIPAALLGKEVVFYKNNYFKNEEVFKNSIRDEFDNVRWGGEYS